MEKFAVVTGASRGIGRALVLKLARQNIKVLAVSRNQEALNSLQAELPDYIDTVFADVSSEAGRKSIINRAQEHAHIDFLVHNAGTIAPLGTLSQVEAAEFRYMMSVNVEAPIVLTSSLIPQLKDGGRVLHISSEAAHTPFAGIEPYCVSKAALYMAYLSLRNELSYYKTAIASVKPGIVKTDMTTEIMQLPSDFQTGALYKKWVARDELLEPEQVAQFLNWLLLEVDPVIYSAEEWDIYETHHHKQWLGSNELQMPDFSEQ